MNLEELWQELEGSVTPDQVHGRRRVYGDRSVDLNITLAQPGPRRGLTLTVSDNALLGVDTLPASRGLEHIRRPAAVSGRTALELRLTDASSNRLFVGLADDVARATSMASDDRHAVGLWISRIRSWQRLMAEAPRGMSGEAQRGLYAELDFLRTDLVPRVGIERAVDGWQGPLGGHDFQLAGGAFEIKGSASHEPQVVTINSERQLDPTGTDSLHLIALSLDVHQYAGETLPDIVAAVRALAENTAAEETLAERLVDARYADAHETFYATTGYTVRERQYLTVTDGFPRIIESDLPEGVGGVRYQLVLAACSAFAKTPQIALSSLRGER